MRNEHPITPPRSQSQEEFLKGALAELRRSRTLPVDDQVGALSRLVERMLQRELDGLDGIDNVG